VASDRPIFVVGCPRSGTTLLQVMLHGHPRIAIPLETRFLVRTYRDRRRFGDLRDVQNRRALARWVTGSTQGRFRRLGLDADTVTGKIVDGPPTLGSALGIVFAAYAERFGKSRWGDKRPGYWQDLDVLLRLFPDAQIVHLVRDPRACVASLTRMPWWREGFDAAVATWLLAQQRCRRDMRHAPAGTYHEMSYERLVTRPEGELRRLCMFLGEDFDTGMLETRQVARDAVSSYQRRRHHSGLRRAVGSAAVDTWRTELSPREVGLVERVAGSRMARLGYTPSGECTPPGAPAMLAFLEEYGRRRASLRKRRVLDALERRHDTGPVGALLTSGQRDPAASTRGFHR